MSDPLSVAIEGDLIEVVIEEERIVLELWAGLGHDATHLRGRPIATTAPASGEALVWNGSAWVPANIGTQVELDAITATLAAHVANTSNPHAVTATQVGAYTTTQVDTIATGLSAATATVASNLATHAARTDNPHAVTKAQVGLGNVENTALSTWAGSAAITTLGTIATGAVPASLVTAGDFPTGIYSFPTILRMQNATVAHPMTGAVPTNVFLEIRRAEDAAGGVAWDGYKDADGVAGLAMHLRGNLGMAADTTKSTSAIAVVTISARVTNGGTGTTTVGADGNVFAVRNNNTTRLLLDAEGTLHGFGASTTDSILNGLWLLNDTSNANMTKGLTINQGADDNQILALKSSDVATGLTSATLQAVETDDYLGFSKFSATLGGVLLQAMAEDAAVSQVFTVRAYGGTANTTKSTAGTGLINFYVSEHDGANALANVAADGNIVVFRGRAGGADVTRFIFDIEGSAHADVEWITFDRHHDLAVIEDMETLLAPGQVQRRFGAVVAHDRAFFEREGLLHDVRDVGGGRVRGMLNTTRATMLAFGAIREVGGRQAALEDALREVLTLNPGLHGAERALALLEA